MENQHDNPVLFMFSDKKKEVWFPLGFVMQSQQNKLFFFGFLRPLSNKNVKI